MCDQYHFDQWCYEQEDVEVNGRCVYEMEQFLIPTLLPTPDGVSGSREIEWQYAGHGVSVP